MRVGHNKNEVPISQYSVVTFLLFASFIGMLILSTSKQDVEHLNYPQYIAADLRSALGSLAKDSEQV